MTTELDIPVDLPLKERRLVWCLESRFAGFLVARPNDACTECFLDVFGSEEDALAHFAKTTWLPDGDGIRPIQLSLESVIQQSLEQLPIISYGRVIPCVGYVWMPRMEFVRTDM